MIDPKRLQEIRAAVDDAQRPAMNRRLDAVRTLREIGPELLSELDRLRAEAAAVIAFVEWGGASGGPGVYQCPACGGLKAEGGHFPGCGFRPFLGLGGKP